MKINTCKFNAARKGAVLTNQSVDLSIVGGLIKFRRAPTTCICKVKRGNSGHSSGQPVFSPTMSKLVQQFKVSRQRIIL